MTIGRLAILSPINDLEVLTVVTPQHKQRVEDHIWILDRAIKRGSVKAARGALETIGQDPYAMERYGAELGEGCQWLEKAIEYEKRHGRRSLLDMDHPLNREIFSRRFQKSC